MIRRQPKQCWVPKLDRWEYTKKENIAPVDTDGGFFFFMVFAKEEKGNANTY